MGLSTAAIGQAAFVWLDESGTIRNRFVIFRRDLTLAAAPQTAVLHLFADSRYRLRVNGHFVYAGPPRFVTQYPEYDVVDLAPHLVRGANCITVEVNAFGASSYQTMPDGRGGFWAAGSITPGDGGPALGLATPDGWRARGVSAWDARAPLYSFAQNPVEILDTRAFDDAWLLPGGATAAGWLATVPVPAAAAPWGPLQPSTAPRIPYTAVAPATIVASASLAAVDVCWGFTIPDTYLGPPAKAPKGLYVAFSSWIHTPAAQTVTAGVFWGDFKLNGSLLTRTAHPLLGNRQDVTLALHAGWNHLTGEVEFITAGEFWSFLLTLPAATKLRLQARADAGETAAFALSPLRPRAELDLAWSAAPMAVLPPDWRLVAGDPLTACPARLTALAQPGPDAVRDLPYAELAAVDAITGAGRVWTFAFAGGALGHVTVEIEAPTGSVVDIGFDDWLRPDGLLDLYRTNPFVNSVERVILRGGRQQVQLFHARGGLYVQVLVRLPADAPAGTTARLHGVGVRQTKTIPVVLGDFHTSDAAYDAIWRAAVTTLAASTEDSYSDSPWRERGTYLGDCYVNALLHPLLHHDLTLLRRVAGLFGQTVTPDGQLLAAAPSHLTPHEEFTLIWPLLLHAYWAATGDTAVVAQHWPVMQQVLAGRRLARHASGLWNADGCRLFIDWGVVREERAGTANAVLNAFRIGALDHAVELAQAIGQDADAARWQDEAAATRAAFARTLWLAEAGRFAAALTPEGPLTTPAFHANILAYRFQIGTPEQQAQVERYVLQRARLNHALGLANGGGAGHAELYFFVYLLPALAEHGHLALAEALMREHWGPFIAAGCTTLPECFARFEQHTGSCCHSWSGYPAVYLTRFVLGLRQTTAGNPDHFTLDPQVSPHFTHASGSLPHARGLITARWTRASTGLECAIDAPPGVTVVCAPAR